jgi:hypothetical protein
VPSVARYPRNLSTHVSLRMKAYLVSEIYIWPILLVMWSTHLRQGPWVSSSMRRILISILSQTRVVSMN